MLSSEYSRLLPSAVARNVHKDKINYQFADCVGLTSEQKVTETQIGVRMRRCKPVFCFLSPIKFTCHYFLGYLHSVSADVIIMIMICKLIVSD